MAENTKIEWTKRPGTIGATMNALVGCQKVSPGCKHCYAIEIANIRAGNPLPIMQEKFAGTTRVEGGKRVWTGKVTLTESALLAPLKAKKPRTYFVNALSDLFYDGVPDAWIDRHFAVFALCPQHTFIVLTKRPERMQKYLLEALPDLVMDHISDMSNELGGASSLVRSALRRTGTAIFDDDGRPYEWDPRPPQWPLPNVWLGVSVEDRAAKSRIDGLRATPAAVRLLSIEPLLENLGTLDLTGIDWVICGGESGPGARPMHPDSVRSVRDQCDAAGVPFFFKQWGEWRPEQPGDETKPLGSFLDGTLHGNVMRRVGKKLAGHELDGKVHLAFPEVAA